MLDEVPNLGLTVALPHTYRSHDANMIYIDQKTTVITSRKRIGTGFLCLSKSVDRSRIGR